MEQIVALLELLISKAPWLASVIMVMGTARLIFKPLFTFLRTVADATPTPKDNELLDKAEKSKLYSAVSFILDWVGSIKLPQK